MTQHQAAIQICTLIGGMFVTLMGGLEILHRRLKLKAIIPASEKEWLEVERSR